MENMPEHLDNAVFLSTVLVLSHVLESVDVNFFVTNNFELKVFPRDHLEIRRPKGDVEAFLNSFVLLFGFVKTKLDATIYVLVKASVGYLNL